MAGEIHRRLYRALGCIFLCLTCSLFGSDNETGNIRVTHAFGNCFLQPLSITDSPPRPVSLNKQINEERPFAFGTTPDSFLEIEYLLEGKVAIIRMGNESALEFQQHHYHLLHKGALLLSHRQMMSWNFHLSDNSIHVNGMGTWMMESLTSGIKVILLEGELSIGNSTERQNLSSGDLVILSSANPKGTKPIKVDLPLLLGTSRLINGFPDKLSSNSRLFSAAQVQALRMKRRYDALIGDVSKEKTLQLWTVPQK